MRTPAALLLASLTLSLFTAPARAAWPVEGDTLHRYDTPASAMQLERLAGGDVHAGLTLLEGTAWNLRGYRIAGDGTMYAGWDPLPLPRAALAFDGTGGAYKTSAVNGRVLLYRVLAAGGLDPAWPPGGVVVIDIGVGTPGAVATAVCARDDSGGVHVAAVLDDARVAMWRLLTDGSVAPGWPAAGYTVRNIDGELNEHLAAIPDGERGVVIAWLNWSGRFGIHMRMQRMSPTGARLWAAGGVALSSIEGSGGPVFGLVRSGTHLYCCWANDVSATVREIRLQRVRMSDGAASLNWPSAGELIAQGHPDSLTARLVGDGAAGAFVAWSHRGELRGVRVDTTSAPAAGWPAGGLPLMDAAGVLSSGWAVAGSPAGFVALWGDGRVPDVRRLRARWLLPGGTADPTQPDSGRLVSSSTRALALGAVSDGAGGAYVGWWEQTWPATGEYNSYMVSWVPYPNPLDVPDPVVSADRLALRAWPNPARDAVQVRFALPDGVPARLELLDVAGRVLRGATIAGVGTHTWRCDGLGAMPAGIYFVRAVTARGTGVARFAVVR